MAKKNRKGKKDEEVVVTEHPDEQKTPTGKRPKKVPAKGKRHRAGARHRDSRTHGYHHLLVEESEEVEIE